MYAQLVLLLLLFTYHFLEFICDNFAVIIIINKMTAKKKKKYVYAVTEYPMCSLQPASYARTLKSIWIFGEIGRRIVISVQRFDVML